MEKNSAFCRKNFGGAAKTAFYVSIVTFRVKIPFWKKPKFFLTFSGFEWKTFGLLPTKIVRAVKTRFYVSVGLFLRTRFFWKKYGLNITSNIEKKLQPFVHFFLRGFQSCILYFQWILLQKNTFQKNFMFFWNLQKLSKKFLPLCQKT